MSVAAALLQIAAGDREAARSACDAVTGSSLLAEWLNRYLAGPDHGDVYVHPDAFERFISGGSNIDLYDATIAALSELNELNKPSSILDVGCGDGRVTAATVPTSCEHLDLLEPSEAMLRTAVDLVEQTVGVVEGVSSTLQDLLAEQPDRRWDAVQSTFAFHNLSPQDRVEALETLASRTASITIVEFDIPEFDDRSAEHAEYAAAAYEAGIAEYEADPTVITGFLLPVLVGQFAPDQPRVTYEQSARAWLHDLDRAGFQSATETPVAEYWWASAKLIHGTNTDSVPQ